VRLALGAKAWPLYPAADLVYPVAELETRSLQPRMQPFCGENRMELQRRRFLRLTAGAAGAAALPALPRSACALDYPVRPVRIVVPYPAAIAPDIVARLVAQALSQRFKQQFIVDNRPGGASNVGTSIVAHAVPDGYTLLVVTATNAINVSLYESLDFNLTRDIGPVAGLVRLPLVLVVNPSVPAQTLGEFIAYAKANPGKLNYASVGSGAATNVAGELFKEMAGIDLVNVPYRGNYMPDRSAARSSRRSLRSSNRSSTSRPASCGRWR